MKMNLDQLLIANGKKAVSLNIVGDIFIDVVL